MESVQLRISLCALFAQTASRDTEKPGSHTLPLFLGVGNPYEGLQLPFPFFHLIE